MVWEDASVVEDLVVILLVLVQFSGRHETSGLLSSSSHFPARARALADTLGLALQ